MHCLRCQQTAPNCETRRPGAYLINITSQPTRPQPNFWKTRAGHGRSSPWPQHEPSGHFTTHGFDGTRYRVHAVGVADVLIFRGAGPGRTRRQSGRGEIRPHGKAPPSGMASAKCWMIGAKASVFGEAGRPFASRILKPLLVSGADAG